MLKKHLILGLFAFILTACGAAPTQTDMLPTTTVQPTPVTPTVTATFLPPPTVTPFPTVTPRPANAEEEGDTTEATAASDEADAPEPTQQTSSPGFPAGVSVGGQVLTATFDQGWPSEDSPTAKYSLQNGQYVFDIGPFDGRFFATTLVSEDDMYAEVEVTPTQCPAEGGYGLFFRYGDASNYYAFTVFCDGSYRVVARVNGALTASTDGTIASGDPAAAQTHTLAVKAEGDTFTFYFDGQEVGTFTDSQLESGDVAIYAVAGGDGVLSAAFDNLRVWTLN